MVEHERKYPKDIMVFDYYPKAGSNLIHLEIVVANRPGAIAKVSAVLARNSVNILSGFHSAPARKRRAVWSLFADVSKTRRPFEEILPKIKAISEVKAARFVRSRQGLVFDSFNFPVRYGTGFGIVLPTDVFTNIVQRLRRDFGTGADVILYEMGMAAGERHAREALRLFGEKAGDLVGHLVHGYSAFGWGIANLVSYDPESAKVTVEMKQSFECEPFRNKMTASNSQFLRGHINGAANFWFGRTTYTTEARCVAKGDDVCWFETTPS